ncbi:hypothetical protein T01_6501 [Trichinella spiralis]|uniref:Uncharacterized protein n=1 Tax=Trichinella spiralis TaxID=6334 RepID=A0A0V1BX48_TRISP|nr:hypothetical protein T01_6501 [Trichinella spiralis]
MCQNCTDDIGNGIYGHCGLKRIVDSFSKCLRSYHVESTASRPICEVKQRWADVSTRIGDGLGTRSVVDIFPSTAMPMNLFSNE